ncbi:FAD/NAD(P)-binding domain-containing protein [Pseudovirgaria hyperparasitica]|uniref:FAD/NAD(P)-binding domain-containing protein n=1 Tax=Pseudovirgaria hyperparasitica TaxID=470096 RepID=A0A6A6WG52_9PEZI|nr:FAD/NAD(P)-binding domain-containing protein [Pseudovirgaria hyperparasitica]KAF2761812.1 FAD/NAD(P)-binding domain-containing protein [Pseudovirgaria hyperparasitica]
MTLKGTNPETIHRVNGYGKDSYTYIPVVVVGGGESGIAMGCRLKQKLGFDQFRIYDRQSGVGGTWWINRYPGVACDIPSILYSFSFAQNPNWTSFFPPGPEMQRYLGDVCAKFQIEDKIQCNVDVEYCRWLEEEKLWEVELKHLVPGVGDLGAKARQALIDRDGPQAVVVGRETVRCKVLVSAVGGLVEPRSWPENIPGIEDFKGPVFHSARWEEHHDFKDKDIIVMGTGCSAAQLVPKLTKEPYNAKSVTQLMRSPPWVSPRTVPPGGNEAFAKYAPKLFNNVPGLQNALRKVVAAVVEYDFRYFRGDDFAAKERARYEERLRRHIKKTTPEKYHEILTPNYGVGCKRRIFDATWYPGLNDPKIEVTTQPLTHVHEHTVTIGPGRTYPDPKDTSSKAPMDKKEIPADMIIMANGFDTTVWLHPLVVKGRNGVDLLQQMQDRGGPQLYQGTAMDEFPNFFAIFGPNTATGHTSVILATENMVNYSLKFIKGILNGDIEQAEIKKEAEIDYTTKLQKKLKTMVWQSGGCHSWYFMENGWNPTVYPWSQIRFTYRCMFPRWRDWNIKYTTKGLWKLRLQAIFRLLAITSTIAVLLKMRSMGLDSLESIKSVAGFALQMGVARGISSLKSVQASLQA